MDDDLINDQQPPVVVPPAKTAGLGDKEKQPAEAGAELEALPGEPEIGQELKEAGVEAVAEQQLKVDKELAELGVRRRGAAAPPPSPAQTLPLTDEQILAGEKKPISFSVFWLAYWCLRQLKKVHISLKKFHGQVIRIKKTKS